MATLRYQSCCVLAIVVQLPKRTTVAQPETVSSLPDDIVVLEYEVVEWSATEGLKDTLYETYRPQRIRMKNALPHPSLLCESAALALVSLEIELTPTQERIYNSYSDAFQVIHHNLDKALEACNISGDKTYNRAAKMSAMSQFESHKQRFFNHLLTGMKCPQLIKAIEEDLAASNAIVIQGDRTAQTKHLHPCSDLLPLTSSVNVALSQPSPARCDISKYILG